MISELICREYENIASEADGENRIGLQVDFSVRNGSPSVWDFDEDRYHRYRLLVCGKHSYTGVYLKEMRLHPDQESDWFCLAVHDSCWRSDGVKSFIWRAGDFISGFKGIGNPFQRVKISDVEEEEFLRLEKERITNRVEHPLFMRT